MSAYCFGCTNPFTPTSLNPGYPSQSVGLFR
jgi:hypothetical protein